MQHQFTFHSTKKINRTPPRKKLEWKPIKYKNSYWQEQFHDSTMTWSKAKDVFAKAETYCLDVNGRSVPTEGKELTPFCAKYMLGRLEGYMTADKKLQLYAWKRRRPDGSISTITFGSRYDFDTLVLENLNNQ